MFMRNFYKLSFIISVGLFANPSGPKIMEGKVSFHFPNQDTLQVVASDKSIIHWEDFSIDKGELTQFALPSELSSCLNKVTSANPSEIFGRLESNGKIYLINPNGILVGDTGRINTNEFIASTLNIKDEDFLSGDKLVFSGKTKSLIINHGKIQAEDGSIYLISEHIQNFGTLSAKNDTVGLATSREILLQPKENTKIVISPNQECFGNIENEGIIEALKTEIRASKNPYSYAINLDGTILAAKNNVKQNKIELEVLDGTAKIKGSIKNNDGISNIFSPRISITEKGSIKDSGKGKVNLNFDKLLCNDGVIETKGGEVSILGKEACFLNSGKINCSDSIGGKIKALIGRYNNKGLLEANGYIGKGGDVLIDAKGVITEVSKGLISVCGNPAGNITLASNRIFTSGKYNIEGLSGGNLFFEAPEVLLIASQIHAGGVKKGGQVHIGKKGSSLLSKLKINPHTRLINEQKNAGNIFVHEEKDFKFDTFLSAKDFTFTKPAMLGSVNSVPITQQSQIELTNPHGSSYSQYFGSQTAVIKNGNVVVTDPGDSFVDTGAGAIFLFNGSTGECIDIVTGGTANDQVGINRVIPLEGDGNYIVFSPYWRNLSGYSTGVNAGAVSFGKATTGIGQSYVSSANSLVGQFMDYAGFLSTFDSGNFYYVPKYAVLNNGNYVVCTPSWNNHNGMYYKEGGAATWGDGKNGTVGDISTTNSLYGTNTGDFVGSNMPVALSNGNFVIVSPTWNSKRGAATWGDGTTVNAGAVGVGNSVVGTDLGDSIGNQGVTPLANGHFVVLSHSWSGVTSSGGAATWVNGTTGGTHNFAVGTTNSVYGSTLNDQVGWSFGSGVYGFVYGKDYYGNGGDSRALALSDGNFVVLSSLWGGAASKTGAATWVDGSALGTHNFMVSTANSLYGTSFGDKVGKRGIALADGKYLILSDSWTAPSSFNNGAATLCQSGGGTIGPVSTVNSLYGKYGGDLVGSDLAIELTDKNFVVLSSYWNSDRGSATWVNLNEGTKGPVTSANSVIGKGPDDFVGNRRPFSSVTAFGYGVHGLDNAIALPSGKFMVMSPYWNDGMAGSFSSRRGAVTFVDPSVSTNFIVSEENSLVGTQDGDRIAEVGFTEIKDGGYIIPSPYWDSISTSNAGAITCGDGSKAISGPIDSSISLIGTFTDGYYGAIPPLNVQYQEAAERYVVGFPNFSPDGGASKGKVLIFDLAPPAIPQLAEDKVILNFYRAISEAGQQWNFWPRANIQSTTVTIPPFGSQTFWYMNNIKTPFEVHEKED